MSCMVGKFCGESFIFYKAYIWEKNKNKIKKKTQKCVAFFKSVSILYFYFFFGPPDFFGIHEVDLK